MMMSKRLYSSKSASIEDSNLMTKSHSGSAGSTPAGATDIGVAGNGCGASSNRSKVLLRIESGGMGFPNPVPASIGLPRLGEEISGHRDHPQHPLVEVIDLPSPFTCRGCKEYGAGTRFSCQSCPFQLHRFCTFAPPLLYHHPLHPQHHLVFNSKPPPAAGGILRSKCDVCGQAIRGYCYLCSACSFQLHPSCSLLSSTAKFPQIHPHTLALLPASATSLFSPCPECQKPKRSGQVYSCTVCDYHLHAVCAKGFVNGLYAFGIRGLGSDEKTSKLGVAGRIVSHIIVGFIGGLVEGIGEGVGEVISQNFVKGKGSIGEGVGEVISQRQNFVKGKGKGRERITQY